MNKPQLGEVWNPKRGEIASIDDVELADSYEPTDVNNETTRSAVHIIEDLNPSPVGSILPIEHEALMNDFNFRMTALAKESLELNRRVRRIDPS